MAEQSSTSAPSSLQNLSRAYKSRDYLVKSSGHKRKLSETTAKQQKGECFEVRDMPRKGGVGTVATRDILCGEVLVSEYPIVSVLAPGNPNRKCCERCLSPVGNLRFQLGASEHDHLPLLDLDDGPEFSKLGEVCPCGARWCSDACRKSNETAHKMLCCGPPSAETSNVKEAPRRFRQHAAENGSQFLLAGQAVAAVLSTVLNDREKKGTTQWSDELLLWWREYNHPLWWNLGTKDEEEKCKKKELCQKSHELLLETLRVFVADLFGSDDCHRCGFLAPLVDRICTLEHYGEIAGMLQCNVMEIEFPSPVQQYVGHVQQVLEEAAEDSENEGGDEGWASWLEKNEQDDSVAAVVGSGLFPILTLANHDCDPNASIEFLGGESSNNRGSLVTLRNISCGEEITITYVPNGDFDCGDVAGERFRHFQPTKTWRYLNRHSGNDVKRESNHEDDVSSGEDDEESDNSIHQNHSASDDHESKEDQEGDGDDDSGGEILPEGSSFVDRAAALLQYDFACRCKRCQHEQRERDVPYCRKSFKS